MAFFPSTARRILPPLGTSALAVLFAVTLPSVLAADSTAAQQQVTFEAVTTLPSRAPDRILYYGDSESQFVEFWQPPGTDEQAPTIVLAHGGCWLDAFAVDHMRPAATQLADQGFAVWAVEYRRLGEDGGGWPQSMNDVIAALDLLHTDPPDTVDVSSVAIAGHSAGGHLALLAIEHSQLKPVVTLGLAAITDLAKYAAGSASCHCAGAQFLLSASEEEQQNLNVATTSNHQRVLFFSADDTIVEPQQAQLGATKAVGIHNAGHFDFVHPATHAWQVWTDYVSTALNAGTNDKGEQP